MAADSPSKSIVLRKCVLDLNFISFFACDVPHVGMGLTELDPDGVYNHTTEHKAVVIKELLSKLGVKR